MMPPKHWKTRCPDCGSVGTEKRQPDNPQGKRKVNRDEPFRGMGTEAKEIEYEEVGPYYCNRCQDHKDHLESAVVGRKGQTVKP